MTNCVECGVEFIPYKTGHFVHCNDCHDELVKSMNLTVKNKNNNNANLTSHDELVKFEKSFHSMKFHRKFYR